MYVEQLMVKYKKGQARWRAKSIHLCGIVEKWSNVQLKDDEANFILLIFEWGKFLEKCEISLGNRENVRYHKKL